MHLVKSIIAIGGLLAPALLVTALPPGPSSDIDGDNSMEHLKAELDNKFYPHSAVEYQYDHNPVHGDYGHGKRKVSKREQVINAKPPVEAIDMKWHVQVWPNAGCPGDMTPMEYSGWFYHSTGCIKLPNPGLSFALHGNMRNCTHFWYWNDSCTKPAEIRGTMGDFTCNAAPGAKNAQQLGSFQLVCPNGNSGWKDSTNPPTEPAQ